MTKNPSTARRALVVAGYAAAGSLVQSTFVPDAGVVVKAIATGGGALIAATVVTVVVAAALIPKAISKLRK